VSTLDGFWFHFDTDSLSDDENPAVDYRLPGGLSLKDAEHLLSRLLESDKITGMSVTILILHLTRLVKLLEEFRNALGELLLSN